MLARNVPYLNAIGPTNIYGIKNIFRYLQGTKYLNILYQFQRNLNSNLDTGIGYLHDPTMCTYMVELSLH